MDIATRSYATVAANPTTITKKTTPPPPQKKPMEERKTTYTSPFVEKEKLPNDQKYIEIQDFTNKLINASLVSVNESKQYLDIQIARGQARNLPTCEVHYDFPTLFNMNKDVLLPKYPELVGLRPGQFLPKSVGPNGLNPVITVNNKRYYITPIVRKTEELGYTKIYVDSTGLYFYLKPEDLGPLAKEYLKLTEELVEASLPSLEDVKNRLESIVDHPNSTPTHGVFYSYSKLYSGKTSYPEFTQLATDETTLPKEIGTYRLQLEKIFSNEEYFISKIVRKTREMGFEGANVGSSGITYYIKPDDLGPKAKSLYRQFFITKEEILQKAREQKDRHHFKNESEKMIVLTYGKSYSHPQIQRINYELRKYYNKLGYSVTLGYDWRYETSNQRIVMKIYIDPDELNETKSPFPIVKNSSLTNLIES